MKNLKIYLTVGYIIVVALGACKKNILNVQPTTIVTDQQIWTDPKLITGLMASFYDRMPSEYSISSNYIDMCDYDEAMYSGQNNAGNEAHNNIIAYASNRNFLYDYTIIRDLNNAIVNVDKFGASTLDATTRTQLKSEFRFLRAFQYFQMVIREGGVPIVTKPLDYDYSGNAGPLR
ncbi:MAG: RagB/SusD family nutrient uptake outer membrane protein, partial [Mucilaginibacter sp.]|nr:RagB/SusD family nutrient uptake outer membrane protein [Mucilaginibacter sp.]